MPQPSLSAAAIPTAAALLIHALASAAWAQQGAASPGGEGVLPTVSVTATRDATADTLITQGRASSVGKSAASVQDTPFSVSVIDVKQMRDTGAKNVQDALLYSAGVFSGRYGFDTRGDWTAVRGMSPSVYIDGLRGVYGFYNTTRPEIYALEQIEVLKGPSSSLYGQAELGGILNVVSKRPQREVRREVELQLGSHSRKQLAADLTGPLTADGQWLYRLVALKRDSATQVDHVNDDAELIAPSLTWRPGKDTAVTLLLSHQTNKSKVSAQFLPTLGTRVLKDPVTGAPVRRIPTSTFVGEPDWDRYDTRRNDVTLSLEQALAPGWRVVGTARKSHSASVTREHWTLVGGTPDASGNIARTLHTADRKTELFGADVRVEGHVVMGPMRHMIALGVDHQNAFWEEYNYTYAQTGGGVINVYDPVYGNLQSQNLAFADRPDNKLDQTGVYLTDHMTLGDVVVSGALRRDRAATRTVAVSGAERPVRDEATTGRLGLMYRFDNGVSPYVSRATAFVPNLGTNADGGQLKPTRGEQREAGVKYLSQSGNTSVNLAWFDLAQLNREVDGSVPGGRAQTNATVRGWELELRHRMGAWELMGNYTDLNARDTKNKVPLAQVADVMGSGWAQYRWGNGLRAGLGLRHTGSVYGGGGAPKLPSVQLLDLMVGYVQGSWEARFDVKNAADKTYISWCRGATTDCGYGERLNANVTVAYRF